MFLSSVCIGAKAAHTGPADVCDGRRVDVALLVEARDSLEAAQSANRNLQSKSFRNI
jgi:hypothetical protein